MADRTPTLCTSCTFVRHVHGRRGQLYLLCRNDTIPQSTPDSRSSPAPATSPERQQRRNVEREANGRVTLVVMTGALCSAKLRNGDPCRSVATHDEFCAYHAALADDLGHDVVANGDQTKKRNARQREPVIAESEPL